MENLMVYLVVGAIVGFIIGVLAVTFGTILVEKINNTYNPKRHPILRLFLFIFYFPVIFIVFCADYKNYRENLIFIKETIIDILKNIKIRRR
jgi:hypothetical protein